MSDWLNVRLVGCQIGWMSNWLDVRSVECKIGADSICMRTPPISRMKLDIVASDGRFKCLECFKNNSVIFRYRLLRFLEKTELNLCGKSCFGHEILTLNNRKIVYPSCIPW